MNSPSSAPMGSMGPHTSAMDYIPGECRPSQMLWNWHVIDNCLISSQWHITSSGMFAGSCIAVICLTMSLECLRRGAKEYDRHILRQYQEKMAAAQDSKEDKDAGPAKKSVVQRMRRWVERPNERERFRPSVEQQIVRGLLHTGQFAVAYFVMLLAMYYNGYIIICIFIGAFLGFVCFEWDWISFSGQDCTPPKPQDEATSCCG